MHHGAVLCAHEALVDSWPARVLHGAHRARAEGSSVRCLRADLARDEDAAASGAHATRQPPPACRSSRQTPSGSGASSPEAYMKQGADPDRSCTRRRHMDRRVQQGARRRRGVSPASGLPLCGTSSFHTDAIQKHRRSQNHAHDHASAMLPRGVCGMRHEPQYGMGHDCARVPLATGPRPPEHTGMPTPIATGQASEPPLVDDIEIDFSILNSRPRTLSEVNPNSDDHCGFGICGVWEVWGIRRQPRRAVRRWEVCPYPTTQCRPRSRFEPVQRGW